MLSSRKRAYTQCLHIISEFDKYALDRSSAQGEEPLIRDANYVLYMGKEEATSLRKRH